MKIRLETERLFLREVEIADASFVLALYNTPDFLRFIGDRNIKDLHLAEKYIQETLIRSYTLNGYGLYVMETKNSGEAIGLCGLVKREALIPPDIGFSILPEYYRQGYTLEAARAVMIYAYEALKLTEVLGRVHPDNQASIALLRKIGIPDDGIIVSTN